MSECVDCWEEPVATVRDGEPVCGLCAIERDAEAFAGTWSCGDSEVTPEGEQTTDASV